MPSPSNKKNSKTDATTGSPRKPFVEIQLPDGRRTGPVEGDVLIYRNAKLLWIGTTLPVKRKGSWWRHLKEDLILLMHLLERKGL